MRRSPSIKLALVGCLIVLSAWTSNAQELEGFEAAIKAGRYEEARAGLAVYSNLHPGSWQALYQLGYVDFRLHRLQESVATLCKSLLLNREFAESHKILAYDLNMLKRPDLARAELKLAIQFDPLSEESHYELGRIDYEQGSYSEAVGELEKAKSLAPDSVRVYHNLGLAYSALDNHALAEENFKEGLRLNDKQAQRSAWPLIDYAVYCNAQNRFQEARELLLEATVIDGSWDQEYEELSKAYRGLGQVPQAIAAIKRAIALNPGKAEPHYVLSRLYAQEHREADAKAELALYQRGRDASSQ